jgi:hypothetical protein
MKEGGADTSPDGQVELSSERGEPRAKDATDPEFR